MPDSDTDLVKDIENEHSSEQEKSDFKSSYRNYKLKEELQREYYKFDDFNYKLELLTYTLIIIISVFIILQNIINLLDGMRFSTFLNTILIFGYTTFFGYYLLKRTKKKFRQNLIERLECQYKFEENKNQ